MSMSAVDRFLADLDAAGWLAFSGIQPDGPARVLPNWKEVFACAKNMTLVKVLEEEANLMREEIFHNCRHIWDAYNDVVGKIRPKTMDLIARKLSPDDVGLVLPKDVIDSLRWIVLHAALEVYYQNCTTRGFFRHLADWLKRGHLPLAWDGNWPEGRAIVY